MKKNIFSKILITSLILFLLLSCVSCKKCNKNTGNNECTEHLDANLDGKCDKCNETVKIECTEHKDLNADSLCDICNEKIDNSIKPEPPKPQDITIAIVGSSEVKSGQSIKLTANVSGADDTSVIWEVTKGNEYVTLSSDGVLTAKEVSGDKIIEVTAKSNANTEYYGKKTITLVSKPLLTDAMLDVFNGDMFERTSKIPMDKIEEAVKESIIEEEQKLTMMYVSRGYKVIKKNYITIKPVVQHPRKFVCPINKKEYDIPKRYRILITAGCGFKSYVNKDKKMPDKMCRFVQ